MIRKLLGYLPQNNMEDAPFMPGDDPLRMDWRGRGVVGRLIEVTGLLALLCHPRDAGLAALGVLADRFTQLRQDGAGIADQHVLGRERPRGISRLDVDLDECLPRRIEQVSVFARGVGGAEFRADHQHQIGIADDGIRRGDPKSAVDAEREIVRLRKRALAAGTGCDRNAKRFGQRT